MSATGRNVLLVDTETWFINRFSDFLRRFGWHVELVNPATTHSSDDGVVVGSVAAECSALLGRGVELAAVFVDLVVREERNEYSEGPSSYDTVGIQIGVKLREICPGVPIFIITGKGSEPVLLSEASLEDFEGLLFKQYLTGPGMSSERLAALLEKGRSKLRARRPPSKAGAVPSLTEPVHPSASLAVVGSRQRLSNALRSCGGNVWPIVDELLERPSGTIEALQAGRSGAVVFKVTTKLRAPNSGVTMAPKSWILKVAQDRRLIDREVENYTVLVRTQLSRLSYPQLLPKGTVTAAGLWGLALTFEGDACPLRDLKQRDPSHAESIGVRIGTALRGLYSDASVDVDLWSHYWSPDSELGEQLTWVLDDLELPAREQGMGHEWRNVRTFVEEWIAGKRPSGVRTGDAYESRWIHGDLNSGNVLVRKGLAAPVVLLDFASAGKGHIARDVAKLERDVFYRLLDGQGVSASADWNRIPAWKAAVEACDPSSPSRRRDAATRWCVTLVGALRRELSRLASRPVDLQQYTVAVLGHAVRGLLIPDLTIQKRVFGVWYVSALLKRIKTAGSKDQRLT